MYSKVIIGMALASVPSVLADAGYILPDSGTASTSQFVLSSEFGSGTSCGVKGMPQGQTAGSGPGQGTGQLYAAINQLAFGANPSANAGGAGGACGICYKITPMDASGQPLAANALTFMIVDECPADKTKSGSQLCNQCKMGDANTPYGQNFHFDIGSDAMTQQQYNQFYQGVTDGQNWKAAQFQKVACDSQTNQPPQLGGGSGCISGNCPNNNAAGVCDGVTNRRRLARS